MDPVLKSELRRLYVGLPNFRSIFFGCVPDIKAASATIFRKYNEDDKPLFGSEG